MNHLTLRILQTLHQEHMAMVSFLERLESLLDGHGPTEAPAPDDTGTRDFLVELETFMKDEIGPHYDFEEQHLFPRFTELAGDQIPMMLKDEHQTIRPLALRLGELAREASATGFKGETWREFHNLGTELAEREIFHVQKEEMGFLPGLQQILDPSEDQALVDAYAEMKDGA